MKKTLYLMSLVFIMFASSCSHTIYNTKSLQGNYDVRMDGKSELEVKSKVRVFLSEKDVNSEYDVISINEYSPLSIPILLSKKSQINKKFLEKAVKKAYEQGGNGIIITAGGSYKVISIYGWDSDNAEASEFVNAILNTSLMEKFNNGDVAKLSAREIKRCVTDLSNEIDFNLKTVRTSQEANVIGSKIEALQNWNNSQPKPDSKLAKKLEAYQTLQKTLLKKILKKEAKKK